MAMNGDLSCISGDLECNSSHVETSTDGAKLSSSPSRSSSLSLLPSPNQVAVENQESSQEASSREGSLGVSLPNSPVSSQIKKRGRGSSAP